MATIEIMSAFPPGAIKLLWVALVLFVIGAVFGVIVEVRGNSKKPPLNKKQHASEIRMMINFELEDLYDHPAVIKKVREKLKPGDYRRSGDIIRGELNSSDVVMLSELQMKFLYANKWKLNNTEQVAEGRFGKLELNPRFFCARTLHHHLALGLAAQLLYFQLYALSGRDPRKIQGKERRIESACETILSLSGKFGEYSAMREHEIVSLVKTERKVNDEVREILNISEEEAKEIEEDMKEHSRNITDWFKLKWHVTKKADDKLAHLLNKEKRHLEKLVSKAEQKKKDMEELARQRGIDSREEQRLQGLLHEISAEIIRFRMIISSLDKIIANRHNWKVKHRLWHNMVRARKAETNEIAEMIHKESEEMPIDVQHVHAILTSLTIAKAKLLNIISAEEEIF